MIYRPSEINYYKNLTAVLNMSNPKGLPNVRWLSMFLRIATVPRRAVPVREEDDLTKLFGQKCYRII